MTSRDIGDISTHPGGRSGADWTADARDSLAALWSLNAGLLTGVSGTNTLTAIPAVPEGFTGYSDGLRATFLPVNNNTGPATININSVGAKAIASPDGEPLSAGAIVAGRVAAIIFYAEDDHFRLETSGGTTNVTVQGGILLQRSGTSRLVTAAGPATTATVVASSSFQCLYSTSRVFVEGTVGRVTSSGSSSADGVVISLYVDGVLSGSFTDHCQTSAQVNTPYEFIYSPGDISSHTYEIRVSSTISATYPKGVNTIKFSEISPPA